MRASNRSSRKPPPVSPVKIRVVIPSTIFVGEDERLGTFRVGAISRYLAIFRVEEIMVFGPHTYVIDVLRYAETPQYLRRKLIPKMKALRYVGVIPPLQAPNHPPLPGGCGFVCEYREGVVVSTAGEWTVVDVGLGEPITALGRGKVGERVIVRMGRQPAIVERSSLPYYWSYRVLTAPNLRSAIDACKGYVKIATSRLGTPLRSVASSLVREINERRLVAIFFGDRRGLYEHAAEEGFELEKRFDYIVNLVPEQGVYTIRTEEAIPIALSMITLLMDLQERKEGLKTGRHKPRR